jgi:hypothetical protein
MTDHALLPVLLAVERCMLPGRRAYGREDSPGRRRQEAGRSHPAVAPGGAARLPLAVPQHPRLRLDTPSQSRYTRADSPAPRLRSAAAWARVGSLTDRAASTAGRGEVPCRAPGSRHGGHARVPTVAESLQARPEPVVLRTPPHRCDRWNGGKRWPSCTHSPASYARAPRCQPLARRASSWRRPSPPQLLERGPAVRHPPQARQRPVPPSQTARGNPARTKRR